jgi:hypothetical protein
LDRKEAEEVRKQEQFRRLLQEAAKEQREMKEKQKQEEQYLE